VAIALALAVAPASGAEIAEPAARALATVRQVMPARLRARVDAVNAVTAAGPTRTDPEVLVAVSEAVHLHEVLRFGYGTDDRTRRVEPHAVVARNGRWYLLAHDPDAGDWRTFRVDRIEPRGRTRVRFTPRTVPGGDPATFVAALFKGARDGVDAWPCVGTAVLHTASRTVAPYLPPDATVEDVDGSHCRVRLGSWSWDGLAAAFAGFTVDFVVEGPDELRAAVHATAARLRAAGAR
jgi:predicted DNA-binding transcriptional regulator YafY